MGMKKKSTWIIIATLLLIALSATIFSVVQNSKKTAPDTTAEPAPLEEKYNKDTGEDLSSKNTDALDNISGKRLYTTRIFGMSYLTSLFTERLLETPFLGEADSPLSLDITTALSIYGDLFLEKRYEYLTIITSSVEMTSDNTSITASVRLGDTNDIIPITATILTSKTLTSLTPDNPLRHADIVINKDGSRNLVPMHYIGGLVDTPGDSYAIKQANFSSRDIVITGNNSEGALTYMRQLGYKIPDLSLSFTDIASPF